MAAVAKVKLTLRQENPFRWRGAVTRKELFFDRKDELESATIVCHQIVRDTGGLLILGGRGSGKSSFLNALKRETDALGIASAKISLSEDMTQPGQEPRFFKLILNDLITSADEAQLIKHDLSNKIRQILQGVIENIDTVGFDALGISIIAKAATDLKYYDFPYAMLRDGLKDLLKLLQKPGSDAKPGVLVMLDEGDALTKNKVLLQVLRNVFQELPGTGLVIAGTSKLLADVSEVFSPIPRFFTKIQLGPFQEDSDVEFAISSTVNLAKAELLPRGIRLDVDTTGFFWRVIELSGRVPYEFNLLSHYAFDRGASQLHWEEGRAALSLRMDKEVLMEAIEQLRGTKEYAPLLDAMSDFDRKVMHLLSKCQYGGSSDELSALVALDAMGEGLRAASLEEAVALFEQIDTHKQHIAKSLEKINSLGEKFSIRAIVIETADKAIYRIEDQWIKAYSKYSDLPTIVDLDGGLIAGESGILFFGDPVSSILDSLFLHKLMKHLVPPDSFRVNASPNDGSTLRSTSGKILNASFVRVADGRTWHLAFQLRMDTDTSGLKVDFFRILKRLRDLELVNSFSVRERVLDRPWA
jgi:hypothetical protein